MTDNVTSIFGGATPQEVDQDMIKKLEVLLEACKRGEVTSLTYYATCPRDVIYGWIGRDGTHEEILAGMEKIKMHFLLREYNFGESR